MYHGSNPTALQSQRWLTESLLALMEEKPFARITVMDICRRADLSRQTFYNFFSTREEILHCYLQEKYQAEFSRHQGKSVLTIEEIVTSFATVLTENQRVLSAMIRNGLEWQIMEEISGCISLFANHFVGEQQSDALLPYSEALLSGALSGLLVFWFKQETPISMAQMTALLSDFFQGRLFELEKKRKLKLKVPFIFSATVQFCPI